MMHKAFDIKSAKFEENEHESIHVSCFKRKLSMNVKNDGADFDYLNV